MHRKFGQKNPGYLKNFTKLMGFGIFGFGKYSAGQIQWKRVTYYDI